MTKFRVGIFFLMGCFPLLSSANIRDRAIESFLKEFQSDPKVMLQSLPPKWDASGKSDPLARAKTKEHEKFVAHVKTRQRILSRTKKDQALDAHLNHVLAAVNLGNDDPTEVVESPELMSRTLEDLDRDHLTSGVSMVDAWSDHYWPYSLGVAANRYGDPLFPQSDDWTVNHDYVKKNGKTLVDILARNNAAEIDHLSPAEKYDAITGNMHGGLTTAMWHAVKNMVAENGKIDSWEGICEGWSSAALRVPRPVHAISIPDPSGRQIRFYPSDVKALSSVLWAWGEIPVRFAGGRCEKENPKTDDNGRILDPDCFDTNPATWHLVVTQQLGRLHHSFIMDSSFDSQIWDQPVRKYSYTYFNPQTGNSTAQISEAKIQVAQFSKDKFKKYRSKDAVSVVGIAMDVNYVVENESPTSASTDSPAQDVFANVRYFYDLELDSHNQIIGGEWYHNAHPDFVWMPEPGSKAVSVADEDVREAWSGKDPVPASWQKAAQTAAQSAQPLAKVIERLQNLASH
jgi:hypothetical protein